MHAAPRDLRSLAQQLTTPFLASGKAKNGVFSLRIAHIAPSLCFCTMEFFSDGPRGIECILGPLCMQLRALPVSFFSLWEGPKWGFFPKDRTYRAFFVLLHKRNFFRMVPEGLNAFGTFVHAAETAS